MFLIPTEAVDFHQFLTDADDVDTWMLDILRLVSSDDTGKDEANVQVSHKQINIKVSTSIPFMKKNDIFLYKKVGYIKLDQVG